MAGRRPPLIRRAGIADMVSAAEVYLAAFPDTLRDLHLPWLQPLAVADVMTICLRAEPEAFLVAELEGEVVGYAICPSDDARIWRTAVLRGHVACMLWHWVTGRYGVSLRAALRISAEKLLFWRDQRLPEARCSARVLSLAVAPAAQGRGVGGRLLEAGLGYLRARGAPRVRLEVRPDNAPARHLYQKLGFRSVATTHDTRGPWEVMILTWEGDGAGPD